MGDARGVAVQRNTSPAVGAVAMSIGASGEVVVGSSESGSEEGRRPFSLRAFSEESGRGG